MFEGCNPRGLLEIAKAHGQVEVVPGYKLFATKCLKKGTIIYLDDNHPAEVKNDNISSWPFLFVASSDITGGEPGIFECADEENAMRMIDASLAALKKVLEPGNISGGGK